MLFYMKIQTNDVYIKLLAWLSVIFPYLIRY